MRHACLILASFALLLMGGYSCGKPHAPTAPAGSAEAGRLARLPAVDEDHSITGARSFGLFPLEIGNRWRFHYRFSVSIAPGDTAAAPSEFLFEDDLDEVLVCREFHDGREYTVERQAHSSPGIAPWWIRFRQDRAGLYEWDDASGPPPCDSIEAGRRAGAPSRAARAPTWSEVAARIGVPASARPWQAAWSRIEARRASVMTLARTHSARPPGGVASGEIQRLRYPLYPGRTWVIRDDPRFWSRVERPLLLHTPAGRFPAWSIRILNDFLGPQDVVRVWYGGAGYLGLQAKFVDEATGPNGNPIGTMVAHQSETLTELHLAGRGRGGALPLANPGDDPGN